MSREKRDESKNNNNNNEQTISETITISLRNFWTWEREKAIYVPSFLGAAIVKDHHIILRCVQFWPVYSLKQ